MPELCPDFSHLPVHRVGEVVPTSGPAIVLCFDDGYGFPAHRGGPMFYADSVGLHAVLYALRRFAANPYADPGSWQPAPLLARLGALGKTFNDSVGGKPT